MEATIKHHRSKEEMFSLIRSWKQSGLPQQLFCREHNLAYSVFQYWLKKFKKGSYTPETGFIEMKISSPSRPEGVEIVFPSGAKVILRAADPVLIRSLVQ